MTDRPAVFDHDAAGYDEVALSALGADLRERVHAVLAPLLTPTSRVADLGCGTGIDALWLASRAAHVHAFDPSDAMVAAARRRNAGVSNVTVTRAAIGEAQLEPQVDVALANFGAVNCVADLAELNGHLGRVVRAGGHAVLVTMPRWCPVELGVGALTANRDLLRRRIGTGTYGDLPVTYASAADLAHLLAPDFEIEHAESLGLALPPFEQRHWVEGRPRLRAVLASLDRRTSRIGARLGIGDHHIVVFHRAAEVVR